MNQPRDSKGRFVKNSLEFDDAGQLLPWTDDEDLKIPWKTMRRRRRIPWKLLGMVLYIVIIFIAAYAGAHIDLPIHL